MAKQPLNFRPPNTVSRTVLLDIHGEIILEIGFDDYMVLQPDGSITQHKISTNIQLVDGTQFNPSILITKMPYLGVCEICRHPPFSGLGREKATHGIVTLARTKTCKNCGLLCCLRHVSKLSGDWLCPSCQRKRRLKGFLGAIFFSKEDD